MSAPGVPHYLIAGAAETGETHPRLKIQDLYSNHKQFSLFIRAVANIQDPLYNPRAASWEQIAGIHGLPYETWLGDEGEHPLPPDTSPPALEGPDQWRGYCRHGSVLFPTWHRVLMMLLEQAMSDEAVKIAAEDEQHCPETEKMTWLKAAKELRWPFWDWTDPKTGSSEPLPTSPDGHSLFVEEKIPILDPNSRDGFIYIANPLARYKFTYRVPDGFKDLPNDRAFAAWTRTYRWPKSTVHFPPEQYDILKDTLNGKYHPVDPETGREPFQPWRWLTDQVALLFQMPASAGEYDRPSLWDHFSNTNRQEKRLGNVYPASVEGSHNKVHNDVGGDGHMSEPDYAGFDPIFYMHHCNVDRIFAFWEAVYPDYWMGKGWYETKHITNEPSAETAKTEELVKFRGMYGTYLQKKDHVIDENTPLWPFRKDNNNYWTSVDTRFLHDKAPLKKYYTYPPIDGVSVDTPVPADRRQAYISLLWSHFNHGKPITGYKRSLPLLSQPPVYRSIPNAEPIPNFRQFVMVGELVRSAFGGSYNVDLVLAKDLDYGLGTGVVPAGTAVGSIGVFARTDISHCANCIGLEERGNKLIGAMVLSSELVEKVLEDHEPPARLSPSEQEDSLITHIKTSFKARCTTAGGHLLAEVGATLNRTELDAEIKPKLTLFSAAAANAAKVVMPIIGQPNAHNQPYFFYDWKTHGEAFEDEWKLSA